jgi:hypothetical protein
MQKIISVSLAYRLMIVIFSLVLIFHMLVITGAIPYSIIWGGKLKSHAEMVSFESISIAVNCFMLIIVLMRANIINFNNHPVKIRVALWTMFVLFCLNTIGNFLAETLLEKIIFTPMTLILALLSYRLAIKENPQK